MRILRLIFAVPLLAASMLCAQQAQTRGRATAKPVVKASPPQGAERAEKARRPPNHEALQITIDFRVYQDDERATDRSYTLAVTTGEIMPAIRDDLRVHASPTDTMRFNGPQSDQYLDHNIDVDILDIRRSGSSIFVALRISTKYYSLHGPKGPPSYPIATDTHQYLITPTIPVGKLVTVYAATQVNHHEKEEVQLLVQPMGAAEPVPQ